MKHGTEHKVIMKTTIICLMAATIGLAPIGGCAPVFSEQYSPASSAPDNPEANLSSDDRSDPQPNSSQYQDLEFSVIPDASLVSPQELTEMKGASPTLFVLDIRSHARFAKAFIPGSKNIPAGRQFDLRIKEVPDDRTVAIVSEGTDRVAEVWQTLIDSGHEASNLVVLEGGIQAWIDAGLPTEEEEREC